MNVSSILTKDYENERLCRRGENKPNQTQFKPNLPEGKIDAKCVVKKDYEEKCG